MVAARGRKRAEDTAPNRARDIQRAFRARRAAHLEALEARIVELDAENVYFRRILNMPPAQRPQLGKGPTGRGLAKSRSRLSSDNFNPASSPDPSSDTPTTPGTDANELPNTCSSQSFDDSTHLALDMSTNITSSGFYIPDIPKLEFHSGTPVTQYGQFGNGAIPNSEVSDLSNGLAAEFDGVQLHQGYLDDRHQMQQVSCGNELRWTASPMIAEDADDTPVQGRPFSYPQNNMIARSLSPQLRPASHRRSNTDPQCAEQSINLVNSCHRPDVGDFARSPSPPPLSIAYSGLHNKQMSLLG